MTDSERELELVIAIISNLLRAEIGDAVSDNRSSTFRFDLAVLDITSCVLSGLFAFLRDIVNKVMDLEDIAAGKDAFDTGLKVIFDNSASGSRIELDVRFLGKLIFRNQTDREKKGVAIKADFGSGDDLVFFVDLRDDDLLDSAMFFISDDIGSR